MAINLISFKQLPYDPTRDFTPVALVCSLSPQMLSVNAAVPVATVAELIGYAKSNAGKLSIAFDNTAGAAFAAKIYNKRAGLGLVEVPYRSAAQMTQDVASGVNQVMMSSIAAANAVVQAGKMRGLAVTSGKRFPGLPDLPSLQETVPGMVMDHFFAIVAPVGTSAEMVARLNREIRQHLKGPEIQDRLLALGLATEGGGTPESTAQTIQREQEQRALGKELGSTRSKEAHSALGRLVRLIDAQRPRLAGWGQETPERLHQESVSRRLHSSCLAERADRACACARSAASLRAARVGDEGTREAVVGIPGLQARPLGGGTSIGTEMLRAFPLLWPAGRRVSHVSCRP